MKKFYWIYGLLLMGMLFFIIRSDLRKSEDFNWFRSYDNNDKGPMGGYFFYKLLEMRASKIHSYSGSLYTLSDSAIKNSMIVFFENFPNYSRPDSEAVQKLLAQGNEMMVITSYPDKAFESYRIVNQYSNVEFQDDSLLIKPKFSLMPTYKSALKRSYSYPVFCYETRFRQFDTSRLKVFLKGYDTDAVYGLVHEKSQKQKIYFISIPDIFANYFICNHPNRYLIYSLINYMIPGKKNIIWFDVPDQRKFDKSVLDLIFNHQALYAAWLILLFTLIFYAVFESRRNQRMIPVIRPPQNEILKFTEVVANAHLRRKQFHSIIHEKIHFFNEWVRSNYHIQLLQAHAQELHQLAAMSGNSPQLCERLARMSRELLEKTEISEYEVYEIYKLMKLFKNKTNL